MMTNEAAYIIGTLVALSVLANRYKAQSSEWFVSNSIVQSNYSLMKLWLLLLKK
jgi:hypothetical protein